MSASGAPDEEEYLAELESLLLRLAEQQQSVVARLQALEGGGTGGGSGPDEGPVAADYDWRVLDAAGTEAAWERLIGWVEWLIDVFPVTDVLPGCWFEHPALVWELAALHLAFVDAYESADAPRGAAVGWLDSLQRAHGRWRMWDQHKCAGAGRHKAGHAPAIWPASWSRDARRWAATDAAGRPVPTDGELPDPDPGAVADDTWASA